MTPEEIKELQDELRIANSLIAKLTDQCREFELAHKSKPECNTCEYCLASPLYRGVCTKVEPNHIFTEEDRQKWFVNGQKPDWCPLAQLAHKSRPNREQIADIMFRRSYLELIVTEQLRVDQIHALFDEEGIRKQLKEAQKKLNEWQVQV